MTNPILLNGALLDGLRERGFTPDELGGFTLDRGDSRLVLTADDTDLLLYLLEGGRARLNAGTVRISGSWPLAVLFAAIDNAF